MSEGSEEFTRATESAEKVAKIFRNRGGVEQYSDLNIPLLSGFGEICGRYKDITAICHHALRMKSRALGTVRR
jgi:hypothetical protein